MENNEMLIANIKATMAMEGYNLVNDDIYLINQYLHNEITQKEGIDKIKSDILHKMV